MNMTSQSKFSRMISKTWKVGCCKDMFLLFVLLHLGVCHAYGEFFSHLYDMHLICIWCIDIQIHIYMCQMLLATFAIYRSTVYKRWEIFSDWTRAAFYKSSKVLDLVVRPVLRLMTVLSTVKSYDLRPELVVPFRLGVLKSDVSLKKGIVVPMVNKSLQKYGGFVYFRRITKEWYKKTTGI